MQNIVNKSAFGWLAPRMLGALLSTTFLCVAPAHAADISLSGATDASIHEGLAATYQAGKQVMQHVAQGDIVPVAQITLNDAVEQGVQALRDSGENALADQYQAEWNRQFGGTLLSTRLAVDELGDHDPLSPWLENFYHVLFTKTRGAVRGIRVIQDVWTLNYALMVIFTPHGRWRTNTPYDRIEYRKHFIPFTNIATYWISYLTCKHYLAQYGKLCNKGASELEKLMGRYVAPHISDFVFARANGVHVTSTPVSSGDINQIMGSEAEFENSVRAAALQ